MSYTDTADVVVTNNFPFEVSSIELKHKYSSDTEQKKVWENVAQGATTSGPLKAGFNTGFIRDGQDTWMIIVTLPDGTKWSSSWHQCTMNSSDSAKTLPFTVDAATFKMEMPSGGCTTSLSGSNGYNSLCAVQILNKFPVAAKVSLTHHYSNDATYEHAWKDQIAPGEHSKTSEDFIVYFQTGVGRTGSDYWNIEVILDVPPYDDQPEKAFTPWKNGTVNKACMLESSDNNKLFAIEIGGGEWKLDIASGSCTDNWITPNGYNTTAFIAIKNDFTEDIQKVVLSHQYSGDTKYHQTRTTINVGKSSSPLMFVEYNTGFGRTGYDYWNVTTYLTNGKYYINSKTDKRCYMTEADSTGILTFTVSDSTFGIGLPSGSCTDSMKLGGVADLYLGRVKTATYDKNAYLATHNAFANFDDGYWYAQQSMNLTEQLANGVSCLLLDIWDYDNDVCLVHETTWLKPFGRPAKLSEALQQVADYLSTDDDGVVTIVFEDHVTINRSKIKQAFESIKVGNVSLWDMVFFANQTNKGWSVSSQGWPTIEWMITNNLRLVVFSSVMTPFPYQWSYMSENVYGDASLDQASWLEARSESQPLNQLALCALNHFPTWAPAVGANWLTDLLSNIATTNKYDTAVEMFTACKSKWGRLPNYFQVDFFEKPGMDAAQAVTKLNTMFHGAPLEKTADVTIAQMLNVQVGVDQEADLLPGLITEWNNVTSWLEAYRDDVMAPPEHSEGSTGLERLCDTLAASGNYTMLLYGLSSPQQKAGSGPSRDVQDWVKTQAETLADQLEAIHAKIGWGDLDDNTLLSPRMFKALLPIALIREITGHGFEALEIVANRLLSNPEIIQSIIQTEDRQDSLLLLQLLALGDDTQIDWSERLDRTLLAASKKSKGIAHDTLMYELTHEVFFATLFGRNLVSKLMSKPQVDALQNLLYDEAINHMADGKRDIGAELLAAYWSAGGKETIQVSNQIILPLSKLQLPRDAVAACCKDCEPKSDDASEIRLHSLDQALALRSIHEVITTTLAIGMTLNQHQTIPHVPSKETITVTDPVPAK